MAKAKYSKGKDGYFRAKVWDGTYNPDGSKHRINLISKKSSADLEKKVNELKDKVYKREYVTSSDISLYDYAIEWLDTYKVNRSRNTYLMYRNIIDKHIIDLSDIPLQHLTHARLQSLINERVDRPRTCQQLALTLKQILKSASKAQLIPINVAHALVDDLELPSYKSKEKRALTELEIKAIKTADFTDREKCFVYLLYSCGLRRGEALALTKYDISLENAEISITKSMAFEVNKSYIKETKTVRGQRTVPMPGYLKDFLKDYIKTVDNYLITKVDGSEMTLSSFEKMWEQIIKKMNIAAGGTDTIRIIHGLTPHIFRHNYCTRLCYQVPAISTKMIAKLLGDTEKMVIDVYSHILVDKEQVNNSIETAISL